MAQKSLRPCVMLAAFVALAGCATQRPVLYPNARLKTVGESAAERDIADCPRPADDYIGSKSRGADAAGALYRAAAPPA
jgi:hypothetical protein